MELEKKVVKLGGLYPGEYTQCGKHGTYIKVGSKYKCPHCIEEEHMQSMLKSLKPTRKEYE